MEVTTFHHIVLTAFLTLIGVCICARNLTLPDFGEWMFIVFINGGASFLVAGHMLYGNLFFGLMAAIFYFVMTWLATD